MHTGNWGHGKPQAVPTVSSYTVVPMSHPLPWNDPAAFGDLCPSQASVCLVAEFKRSRGSLADKHLSGWSATVTSPDNVAIVEQVLREDPWLHICTDTKCFKYLIGCSKNNFEQKTLCKKVL